ncbi:protein MODIFIER OF SNC1 1 isoform X2 [Triticum aestivum]|uniref:protein MODIFIER OF SNC1 1 isoform X2 n=1 Tax=Triticum aestivum TaxID=4565 RepID=UPI001D023132|nr:protein MODIFIER OF SNC1 1-like isoform X2 [Triticum aestivum]
MRQNRSARAFFGPFSPSYLWAAPTRKSGMTVLGKIPKPINLPSQRLENQGLDPNVEIVPKGTLTWGSKPGPTTPNAWNSSSLLSPKKDGNSGAPSQFNGRPSSGGGSRPSTAGSESLDSPNAWGPNSRPSSASGTLPSQNVPVVTNRPRSAETRPGSSQLSRFADNPSDNMNVSIRTVDRSGSSHGHAFTLSTGDFPTLGSEKISESNSQRGHSSKGRPTSSSGKDGTQNDTGKSLSAGSGEVVRPPNNQPADIMKTDQQAHDGSAPFPATGPPNGAQQPQPYPPNYCMPPPQFDSWRAPPGHPPEGMWHRGPGGPYRPVGPSSNFPVEPFPYYGQFPPNSEAAARQGSGHGGYHSKNADAYHSMTPTSYVMNQPVIPARPVYQGPIPYDGYYAPQRPNFNNANVRDSPFIGGPHQPGILNQFPNQNEKFQPGHSPSRAVKHEASPKELSESDRVQLICRGQTRILHDNPDRLVGPGEVERKSQPAPPLLPHPDGNRNDVNTKADTRNTPSERNMVLMKSVHDNRGPNRTSHSSVLENAHSHPRETDDGAHLKKLKEDNLPLDQQPIIKKNAALIEKIGSLNNKARNVDARNVAEAFSNKEIKEKQLKNADSKADRVIKDVPSTPAITAFASAYGQAACVSPRSPVVQKLQKGPNDGGVVGPLHSHFAEASKSGKLGVSTHDRTHRRADSSRNSHHGPAKDMPPNNTTGHGRGENYATESLPVVQVRNSQHDQPLEHVSQLPPDDMPASPDYESQRVKMRELAVQRAKQLQAEEEERTKRQKAKALAKLEELNKRSSVHQKDSSDPPPENDDVRNKQKAGVDGTTEPASSTAESHDVTVLDNVSILQPPNEPKDTAVPAQPMSTLLHTEGTGKDPSGHNTSTSGMNTQSNMTEHIAHKSISLSHDVSVPKPRQGNRKRHAVSEDKILGEKSSVAVNTENVKKAVEVSLDTSTAVVTSHDDPPAHSKKSARNSRNKKKVDDAPATSKYPPMVLGQQNTPGISSEPKIKTAGVIISSSILPAENTVLTVGSITVGGISFGSFNQERLKLPEEAQSTANSRPKPQQAKGSKKIQHAIRPVEKPHGNESVVWAPVKPSGWNEPSEEANVAVAARPKPIGKGTTDGENVTRTKRAEMERYVPKPLSKELQQQNLEQNLPVEKSSVENKSNDNEKLTAAKEPKKWEDRKTSKGHGKSHSSWRRRNTDDSSSVVPIPSERADSYQESHEVQRPSDKHPQLEPDKQADYAAGNSLAPAEAVELPASAAKEHAAANRQRRQHVKGPKNEASNYSNENRDGRKDVNHMSTRGMDANSSEHRNMSKPEVKSSAAHSRAHWKPKSSHSQNNSQGNNTTEGQVDSATLQDSSNRNSNQGKGDMTNVDENQKGESHENAEQQQLNHATRRQGQHNGRYHRGSSAHRGRGYDAGQPSHGANAERRKGSTHLEYQPVGSNKPSDFQQNPSADGQSAGPPAPGPVYRERGHNRGHRPPGGHFVKRNPAPAPAPAPAPNSYREE